MIRHALRGPSLAVVACALALSACATAGEVAAPDGSSHGTEATARPLATGLDYAANPDPYPSTYQPLPRDNIAIVGGTVLTGTDQKIENRITAKCIPREILTKSGLGYVSGRFNKVKEKFKKWFNEGDEKEGTGK